MEIERASDMGFCFGVRRAIDMVQKEADTRGRLQTLGSLVHNRQVVENLAEHGVSVANSLEDVSRDVVAITSHGTSPDIIERAKSKGMEVIDATCPFVRKAQVTARRLSEEGFTVLVFGDADHPEIRGVLGWAGADAVASLQVPRFDITPQKLGILCQTTQTNAAFAGFISDLVYATIGEISELRVFNTICDSTRNHQEAALELAGRVDLMIVVGGRTSANTKRLAEICAAEGVTTYHIENADEIDVSWLRGIQRVGVTAGASTPDESVDEVIDVLTSFAEKDH